MKEEIKKLKNDLAILKKSQVFAKAERAERLMADLINIIEGQQAEIERLKDG